MIAAILFGDVINTPSWKSLDGDDANKQFSQPFALDQSFPESLLL